MNSERQDEAVSQSCGCYKCAGPVYEYTEDGEKLLINNVHGRLQRCEECGRPKTEYVDLGSKGVYRCWWCEDR